MIMRILSIAIAIFLVSSSAHARFSEFVHVQPAMEKNPVEMKRHGFTSPIVTLTRQSAAEFKVTIILPPRNRIQGRSFWLVQSKTPLEGGQLNFRKQIWKHILKMEQSDGFTIAELPIPGKAETSLSVTISASEAQNTYLYCDYPQMVTDGGCYFCFDLPAYYKQKQAEQGGADQPATAPESKPEGEENAKPVPEVRSQ